MNSLVPPKDWMEMIIELPYIEPKSMPLNFINWALDYNNTGQFHFPEGWSIYPPIYFKAYKNLQLACKKYLQENGID